MIHKYIKIIKKDLFTYKNIDLVLFNKNLIFYYEIVKLLKYNIITHDFIKAISIHIHFLFINFLSYIEFFFILRLISFPIVYIN